MSDHSNVGFSGLGRGAEDLGRSRGCGRGVGFVRPAKGKSFVLEEERQLTQSVLAIFQDLISGNQQKGNTFWEQFFFAL